MLVLVGSSRNVGSAREVLVHPADGSHGYYDGRWVLVPLDGTDLTLPRSCPFFVPGPVWSVRLGVDGSLCGRFNEEGIPRDDLA